MSNLILNICLSSQVSVILITQIRSTFLQKRALEKIIPKDVNRQRKERFVVRLRLLEISGNYTHKMSTIWLSKQDLNKYIINIHAISDVRTSSSPNLWQVITSNYGMLREINSPSQGKANQLFNQHHVVSPTILVMDVTLCEPDGLEYMVSKEMLK